MKIANAITDISNTSSKFLDTSYIRYFYLNKFSYGEYFLDIFNY